MDAEVTAIDLNIEAQGGPTSSLDIPGVKYTINGQSFVQSSEGVHFISINRTTGYSTHQVYLLLMYYSEEAEDIFQGSKDIIQ